jgi:WD40 repeat protein
MSMKRPFIVSLLMAAFTAIPSLGQPVRELTGPHVDACAVAFRPDGTRLAAAGSDQTITVWDPIAGAIRQTLTSQTGVLTSLAYSRDGETLAFTEAHGQVWTWQPERSERPRILQGHPACAYACAFSPAGDRLFTCGQDRRVRVWRVPDGQMLHSFGPFDSPLYSLAISPDGACLALGVGDSIVICESRNGRMRKSLPAMAGAIGAVTFSPDGRRLFSGSDGGDVRNWNFETGEPELKFEGHRAQVRQVHLSASGRRLVSADESGLVVVWDTGSGAALSSHRFPGSARCARFAPDGSWIAVGTSCGKLFLMDLPAAAR